MDSGICIARKQGNTALIPDGWYPGWPGGGGGGGGCMGTAPGIVDMLGFQFCMLVVVIRKNSVVVCV